MIRLLATTIGIVGLLSVRCAPHRGRLSYDKPAATQDRNTTAAQQATDGGLKAIEHGDFDEARKCFQTALKQDLYYAPAHNNLGLVLLKAGDYYQAAWEFEFAAKLAPDSPEPRDNLGLLYERIGRLNDAADAYEAALQIDPNRLQTMQNLARAYVKADRRDDRLKSVLEKILLQPPTNPQWDVWARGQLVRLGRPDPDAAAQPFTAAP